MVGLTDGNQYNDKNNGDGIAKIEYIFKNYSSIRLGTVDGLDIYKIFLDTAFYYILCQSILISGLYLMALMFRLCLLVLRLAFSIFLFALFDVISSCSLLFLLNNYIRYKGLNQIQSL